MLANDVMGYVYVHTIPQQVNSQVLSVLSANHTARARLTPIRSWNGEHAKNQLRQVTSDIPYEIFVVTIEVPRRPRPGWQVY